MISLDYFEESEFIRDNVNWFPKMSCKLLSLLDVLRYRLNTPIELSLSDQAIGRNLGPENKSEHNIDYWGDVLAVDCFVKGVYYRPEVEFVFREAIDIGFTGVGIYPHWKNNRGVTQPGFHLGVRPTAKMGSPATWGYITKNKKVTQVSVVQALQLIPKEQKGVEHE